MTLMTSACAIPGPITGPPTPNASGTARERTRAALRRKSFNDFIWFGRPTPPFLCQAQPPADSPPSDPVNRRLAAFLNQRNPSPPCPPPNLLRRCPRDTHRSVFSQPVQLNNIV